MLTHPTSDRLRSLGLVAMAQALEEQRRQPDLESLGFEERLALLVEREATGREDRRLRARLKFAGLRHGGCIEDIDWRAARGLHRALFQRLAAGEWIDRHQGVHLTGPTGVGKTWLACALGHKACRDGRRVLYHRVPRLFEALALSRGDGRHARMLKALARGDLLILDDWGLSVLTQVEREDLLEILEDRHGRGSTIVTSQVPLAQWHAVIGSPTLADAILDRLVHNAHRIELQGESMRKLRVTRVLASETLDARQQD